MAKIIVVVAIISLSCTLHLAVSATTCNRRNYGGSSFVCVCSTASGCDTIDPIQSQPAGTYQMYSSDKKNNRFALTTGNFTSRRPSYDGDVTTITIKKYAKQQEMIGFGGAFTDAAVLNINALPEDLQTELLGSYFGPQGIEYNFGRVPIGGTDFSEYGYSYDDTDADDERLQHFALHQEDLDLKIPMIKRSKQLNPEMELLASVWTAPKWLKTNGKYTGGAIKHEYYQTWADYFLRFFEEYEKLGVSFWGVTTGNEPSLAIINSAINTVGWSSANMRTWIGENFGPTIRNSSFKHLKILTLDDQRFFLPWWPAIVIKGNAEKYVDGIALHWYWDYIVPAVTLDMTHKLFPNQLLLATESCRGDKVWEAAVSLGDWSRAEDYAHAMIQDFNHHVNGWIDWNLALNLTGGPTYIHNEVDAPIIVNATAQEFYKQPMFYAIGHFSKFITRGSYRLEYEASTSNVETAVFQRVDQGIVVIVHNRKSTAQTVVIDDAERGQVQINLNPKSVSSIVYW